MLNNYEELLSARTICEGRCSMGQQCPTGVCRAPEPSKSRRRSSRSQSDMRRSPSTSSIRPKSGPAKLYSYAGNYYITYYPLICSFHLLSQSSWFYNLFHPNRIPIYLSSTYLFYFLNLLVCFLILLSFTSSNIATVYPPLSVVSIFVSALPFLAIFLVPVSSTFLVGLCGWIPIYMSAFYSFCFITLLLPILIFSPI